MNENVINATSIVAFETASTLKLDTPAIFKGITFLENISFVGPTKIEQLWTEQYHPLIFVLKI